MHRNLSLYKNNNNAVTAVENEFFVTKVFIC